MVFKTKKFINLVKNHKCIYDKSYSHKKQREQAWTSIAKQMNIDVKVLQDKWLILRKNFELHLLNKNDPNFSKLLSNKFPFAQELNYLIPYMQKKEGKCSIEKSAAEHLGAKAHESVTVEKSAGMSDSMVVPSTSSKNNIITTKDHIVCLKPIVAYIANVNKKDNHEFNDKDDEMNEIIQKKNDAITLSLKENEESEVSKSTQETLISKIKDEEAPKRPRNVKSINEKVKSPVENEKANKIFFHNILKSSEMSDAKKLFNSTQKAINDVTIISDGETTDEEVFLWNDLFSTSIQEVTVKTSNVGADECTQPKLKNDETNGRKEERMEFETKNDVNVVEGEIDYVLVPPTATAGEPKSPSQLEQTSIAADVDKNNIMESQSIYSIVNLKNNLDKPLPTVISTTIGKVCEVADFSTKAIQQEIDGEKAHPISSVDIPILTQSTELFAFTSALDKVAKENPKLLTPEKITKTTTKHVSEAFKDDPPAKKLKTSTPYIIKKNSFNYFDELDDLNRDKSITSMPICDEGSSECNAKALERTVGSAEDTLVNLRNANSIYEVQRSNETDLILQRRNTLGVFFLAMAQTVNQFSPRRQAKVQREISNAVFSAAEERCKEGSNITD